MPRLFRKTRSAGRKSPIWSVEITLASGRRVAVSTGTKHKRAAEEIALRVLRLADAARVGVQPSAEDRRWAMVECSDPIRDRLRKVGVLSGEASGGAGSLDDALEEWERAIIARGRTAKHAQHQKSQAKAVIDGCGFAGWSEIEPIEVERFLAKQDWSPYTRNHHLQAIRAFVRWMVEADKAPPLRGRGLGLLKAARTTVGRRRVRRALTPDEVRRLLKVAPEPRRTIYRLVLSTGLRAGEVEQLTPEQFVLDDLSRARLRLKADVTKNRTDALVPVPEEAAHAVARLIREQHGSGRLFPDFTVDQAAAMLRADLTAAGIPYQDARGRYADFHALRKTFVTRLALSGVPVPVAQKLARHSTPVLTLNAYTDVGLDDAASAVAGVDFFGEGRTGGRTDATSKDSEEQQKSQREPDGQEDESYESTVIEGEKHDRESSVHD